MALLYTVGTWRVSRASYLNQFKTLGIQLLVDVRGNPAAGRQQELKRSRDFERALSSCGITYEYWGRELGEDALESCNKEGLNKAIDQLAALVKQKTVCIFGHLHEPQGCHRLALCEILLKNGALLGTQVVHLLWEDHQTTKQIKHAVAAQEAADVLRFFQKSKLQAENVRKERKVPDPASNLEAVDWDCFNTSQFLDGRPHHFKLPFDTDLLWYPQWLSAREADELECLVQERVTFIHPTYMFQDPSGGFTKTLIKRGQVRICGDDCPGAVASQPMEAWSNAIIRRVEDAAGCAFNCFVANHYANGQVVINWHSDSGPGDDEGLGPNPYIGSLSLGAKRSFSLKSKRQFEGRMIHLDIPLSHGSLLIMGNNSQTHWLHALLHDESCVQERINLTFRFYARESTKHIEGMEHNHEWEAAPGSTRVRLHRAGFGRPILVDIPNDLVARQLPRYLSTVLPGFRGTAEVAIKCGDGCWKNLATDEGVVAGAKLNTKKGSRAEVSVACQAKGGYRSEIGAVATNVVKSRKDSLKGRGRYGGFQQGNDKGSKGSRGKGYSADNREKDSFRGPVSRCDQGSKGCGRWRVAGVASQ